MTAIRKTLGELALWDQGKKVTFKGHHATITGTLNSFRVESDWIDITQMGEDPDNAERLPGRKTVVIEVGEWRTSGLPLDTVVEVEQ